MLLPAAGVPAHPPAERCHTHIFGDSNRFPFWSDRTYTPEIASVQESLTLQRTLRLSRIVIVNSLVYGTDNSCMADALRHIGSKARGIALVDEATSDGQLDALAAVGVRGIRLNFVDLGTPDAGAMRRRFQDAVTKVRARDWHVQVYSQLPVVQALADDVMQASIPVVFDHFAGARASLGREQTGFSVLVDLVRTGKAWVKLSAAYRISERSPKYPDVAPLAQSLIAASSRRVLWGTDWPHPDSTRHPDRKPTDIAPLLQVDDGELLNQLPVWAPDESVRKRMLVDNPASLYAY
jgi:predicted TIM-barrel fold metal-dependent hydrolase